MSIKIVCIDKLKEKYFKDGITEYIKRMGRFAKVKIIQVPDEKVPEKLSPAKTEQIEEIGGKGILDKMKDKEYVYITAIKGREKTSEDFAKELVDLTAYGYSGITFVIGKSLGTSNAVSKRTDDLISFGRFTVPYQLVWLVLVEQIYRTFIINSGSPCHK